MNKIEKTSILIEYIGCYNPRSSVTSRTKTDSLSECGGICAGFEYILVHKRRGSYLNYECSCSNQLNSSQFVSDDNCTTTWCDSNAARCGGFMRDSSFYYYFYYRESENFAVYGMLIY